MDEDISIINSNTRKERIKNFFLNNKKKILIFLIIIVLLMISFFGYGEFKDYQREKASNLFHSTIIDYDGNNKEKTIDKLKKIIKFLISLSNEVLLIKISNKEFISLRFEIKLLSKIKYSDSGE